MKKLATTYAVATVIMLIITAIATLIEPSLAGNNAKILNVHTNILLVASVIIFLSPFTGSPFRFSLMVGFLCLIESMALGVAIDRFTGVYKFIFPIAIIIGTVVLTARAIRIVIEDSGDKVIEHKDIIKTIRSATISTSIVLLFNFVVICYLPRFI